MKDFRFQISNVRFMVGVVVLAAGLAVSVLAQTQTTPTPKPATDEFVPMSELAAREVLPATPLVFYAYAFVWVALMAYVFFLWRRMARVEQDLAAVQRRLPGGTGGR
jgi:CcmD family protein